MAYELFRGTVKELLDGFKVLDLNTTKLLVGCKVSGESFSDYMVLGLTAIENHSGERSLVCSSFEGLHQEPKTKYVHSYIHVVVTTDYENVKMNFSRVRVPTVKKVPTNFVRQCKSCGDAPEVFSRIYLKVLFDANTDSESQETKAVCGCCDETIIHSSKSGAERHLSHNYYSLVSPSKRNKR